MNHKLQVNRNPSGPRTTTNIIFCLLTSFFLLLTSRGSSFGLDEGLWGRNPFLTIEEIGSLQKKETPPLSPDSRKILLPKWEIKAILISGSSKVVTINDRILTVGDFLADERILEIKEDYIVLGKNGKKRVIKQRQPPIPIKAEEER